MKELWPVDDAQAMADAGDLGELVQAVSAVLSGVQQELATERYATLALIHQIRERVLELEARLGRLEARQPAQRHPSADRPSPSPAADTYQI